MTNIDQKLVQMQKQMESMEQANVDKLESKKPEGPMMNIDQKLAEMQKQMELMQQANCARMELMHQGNRVRMESIRQENRVRIELIRQECRVGVESIWQEIRRLMSTIKINQPVQLQLEEGSGFVDATPGVINGEQNALQLTEGFELAENEEYISLKYEYYAYFYGRQGGLFRIKIPSCRNEDIKVERVILSDPSNPLPHCMVLFSHRHDHNIYLVGSQIKYQIEYSDGVYVIDHNRFQKLPIQDLGLLDQPKELHDSFKTTMKPSWVQSEDQIYLISLRNHTWKRILPFDFQSFDLTKNLFKTLEPPPFKDRVGTVVGFFPLSRYIYLFIEKVTHDMGYHSFRFNPRSSQWEKLTLHFDKEKFPIPSSRIGDVGLSQEFSNKSRILVTLNDEGPAAYSINFCHDGSLRPNSYRRLDEIFVHRKYKTEDDYAHLHDIGQGKFCVVYRSRNMPLLIYVFKIDFDVEHRIQVHGIKTSNPSSQVLYSKICQDPIPLWDIHFIDTFLLDSSTSNEAQDMAATSSVGKEVKKNNNGKSRRHRSGSKKSNSYAGRDMAATSSVDKGVEKKEDELNLAWRGIPRPTKVI